MFSQGLSTGKLTPQEYDQFREFLEETCGIILGGNKQYLVESRLARIMKDNKLSNLNQLMEKMSVSRMSRLRQSVVDAMTTNETLWFRDAHPFQFLKEKAFKELANNTHGRAVRIWCAACSSGQEPYSISILLEEAKRSGYFPSNFEVKVIATDISSAVLEQARAAKYEARALSRGLKPEFVKQYFKEDSDGMFHLAESIKRRVDFRVLNLKDSYSQLGKVDIVFCRNVLIYFSAELKLDILTRIHAMLPQNGYLLLGASESLNDLPSLYEMVRYRPGIAYSPKSV